MKITVLDLNFFKNCFMYAIFNEKFTRIYNCFDRKAIAMLLECPHQITKAKVDSLRSFAVVKLVKKAIFSFFIVSKTVTARKSNE